MNKWVVGIVGVVALLVGALWTLQGSNVIGGSVMSGSKLWLGIGIVLLVLGAALVVRLVRRPS